MLVANTKKTFEKISSKIYPKIEKLTLLIEKELGVFKNVFEMISETFEFRI